MNKATQEENMRANFFRTALFTAAIALVGLVAASTAKAQIGVPVDIGSNQSDVVVAGTTSLSLTTTAAVPAGATIIVIATSAIGGGGDAVQTGAACSDN